MDTGDKVLNEVEGSDRKASVRERKTGLLCFFKGRFESEK